MKNGVVTKYYFAGASRIALRKYTIPQNMTIEYMLGDHLGSTSITTDTAGAKISELRYKAWGETRYTWTNAPVTTPTYELTKYQFTGQYSYSTEFGLHFYGARFYDSSVGRFVSADTMIPSGTQGYDRYAYANNSPVRFNDPSGHKACDGEEGTEDCETTLSVKQELIREYGVSIRGRWDEYHLLAVLLAVQLVGQKFASVIGDGNTAGSAFQEIFGHLTFGWGGIGATGQCAEVGSGGCTSNAHQINFWSMSGDYGGDISRGIKNIVHELGHAYDNSLYDPATGKRASGNIPGTFVDKRFDILRPNPLCDVCYDWQQNREQSPHETFADMFIAWVYGAWNTDPANANLVASAENWMNGLVP